MLTAAGNPVAIRDYATQPLILELEKLADVNAPYDYLAKDQPANHPFAKALGITEKDIRFGTVIIDSLTEVQRLALDLIVGGGASPKPGDLPPRTTRQNFGTALNQMLQLTRLFCSLPVHLIITTLEATKKVNSEENAPEIARPLLWGQSDIEVPGYVFQVGRIQHASAVDASDMATIKAVFKKTPTQSVIWWHPKPLMPANKDQIGVMGPVSIDMPMSELYDKVFGEGGELNLPRTIQL